MTKTHVDIDPELDSLVGEWHTLTGAASMLGLPAGRVKQWVKEGKLVAAYRAVGGGPQVPAAFFADGEIIKGLPGTLTLLADAGYDDVAALRWLFTEDDTLPGSPVQALRENRGTEVRRRAQALAF
ncbi:DNA-binding protein [Actinocorallia sp. API 0066]|uniref:Rv2175c family DNA-binding protein n=1 Tax=Actinocorallia sp. API 0066 TaxID=2896846 RepID=UPI001E46B8B0|nr:Rv2175c family DNA-binding protein [Actinocorallia sp. API 0066]MCD0450953.1 DNA-binding protein [Actinocorallia sp. API 0066]